MFFAFSSLLVSQPNWFSHSPRSLELWPLHLFSHSFPYTNFPPNYPNPKASKQGNPACSTLHADHSVQGVFPPSLNSHGITYIRSFIWQLVETHNSIFRHFYNSLRLVQCILNTFTPLPQLLQIHPSPYSHNCKSSTFSSLQNHGAQFVLPNRSWVGTCPGLG